MSTQSSSEDERWNNLVSQAKNLSSKIQAEKARLAEALQQKYKAEGEILKHQSLLAAANYSIAEAEQKLSKFTDGHWNEADTNALKPVPHVPVQN